ncbi:uncharacterized protein [Leptinotarsa decemlineata]|uniref:uncharacterized protein n=1 Tax=Leptinotarsa decemlineata TaxID=7539 RepID=UPI003D30A580
MKNINDFEIWKSNTETINNCSYVLKSRNASTIGEIVYYKCNRSTSYILSDNSDRRHRLLKSQGSCKINSSCTSEIKVVEENNKILIEWQKVHYGHNLDIQYIRLPKTEKQNIATKITNGVAPQRILESTRDNIGEHLKRVDLLSTKDLRNIKISYGLELKDGKRDSNDAFSVALWVKECENLKEKPILLYKEQGKDHSILRKEDFCLIIMNKFQRQMMKQFPSTITIDSTHGLNDYDFEMTTIMVLDEYHHGFPVAEMFTNRKDTIVQSIFFSVIKDTIGVIHCKFFMSDMAEVFFNAWYGEMGPPYPQHLFCSWHVDRARQSNLNKISTKDKCSDIYKILKILILKNY